MPNLDQLQPYFKDISAQLEHTQLKELHERFIADFVGNKTSINGKDIYIEQGEVKISEYKGYNKSFYHIVTRYLKSNNTRIYECERANRVHWVKPILESHPCKDILYYKFRDARGYCSEHFWAIHKKFMVVLRDTAPGKQIVTSFCVDDGEKDKYFSRYAAYRDGSCDCP